MKGMVSGTVGAATAALLCGCVAAVIGNAPYSGTPADARAGAHSGASLDATVRARLGADAALRGAAIGVSAAGGTVTLHGTVATVAQRAEAERMARTVAGVSVVDNQLGVN